MALRGAWAGPVPGAEGEVVVRVVPVAEDGPVVAKREVQRGAAYGL